jgi:hypothetical protein
VNCCDRFVSEVIGETPLGRKLFAATIVHLKEFPRITGKFMDKMKKTLISLFSYGGLRNASLFMAYTAREWMLVGQKKRTCRGEAESETSRLYRGAERTLTTLVWHFSTSTSSSKLLPVGCHGHACRGHVSAIDSLAITSGKTY